MGQCWSSRFLGLEEGDGEDVVSLCRERKRVMKSLVERRTAFADSHYNYMLSLQSMAQALHHFTNAHTTPSPLFITLPSSSPPSSPPHLPPLPPPPTAKAAAISPTSSCSTSPLSSPSTMSPDVRVPASVPMETPLGFQPNVPDNAWDFFFNPFELPLPSKTPGRISRCSEEDWKAVREEEGIPDLEEVDEDIRSGRNSIGGGDLGGSRNYIGGGGDFIENGGGRNYLTAGGFRGGGNYVVIGGSDFSKSGGGFGAKEVVRIEADDGMVILGEKEMKYSKEEEFHDEKCLTVVDTPARERDLVDALRDIEDHFIRAYDSGKEVSRMLEVNKFKTYTAFTHETKDNSSKFIHAITWHRSTSSSLSASSSSSYLHSSSETNSMWKKFDNDLFEDCGMLSGSHSLTLDSLLAWEKKLYDEVKACEATRKMYQRKCLKLSNQRVKGADSDVMDKTSLMVKDLYTRIWVAMKSAESIAAKIEKLRDEQLLPQLCELLQGMMKTWAIMLESHETQNQIMYEVKSFTSSSAAKFCNNSHRHATVKLEVELQNWRTRFLEWIASQRAYVEALNGWLSKFIVPGLDFHPKLLSLPPYRVNAPPLRVLCHDWLSSFEKLPEKAVCYAIRSFSRDVRALWTHQGEEQEQKRKVESLAKELDTKVERLQRAERRMLSESKQETEMPRKIEYLVGSRDMIDMFKKRLDFERAKHLKCMQDTRNITLNGFQTGFTSIFESLSDFSKASLKTYEELVMYSRKAQNPGEVEKPCLEEAKVDVEETDDVYYKCTMATPLEKPCSDEVDLSGHSVEV